MINRLTEALRPERCCEEDALKTLAALPDADLIVEMVERARRCEWHTGARHGRVDVKEEFGLKIEDDEHLDKDDPRHRLRCPASKVCAARGIVTTAPDRVSSYTPSTAIDADYLR